jgi:hypothetical protein
MTNRIKEWIDQSKKRPGVVSEIHIDELSRRFLSDRHWVSGTIELMEKAGIELRKGRRREILVAAFALVTLDVLQGPTYSNLRQLKREFTVTPPSLYVFAGDLPWHIQEKAFRKVSVKGFPMPAGNWILLHCEYKEENDKEYRRSLWLVPAEAA